MGYLWGPLEQRRHWTEFWVFKIQNETRSPLIASSPNHNSVQCIANQDALFRSPFKCSSTQSDCSHLRIITSELYGRRKRAFSGNGPCLNFSLREKRVGRGELPRILPPASYHLSWLQDLPSSVVSSSLNFMTSRHVRKHFGCVNLQSFYDH